MGHDLTNSCAFCAAEAAFGRGCQGGIQQLVLSSTGMPWGQPNVCLYLHQGSTCVDDKGERQWLSKCSKHRLASVRC
jgi:hypothetical protein